MHKIRNNRDFVLLKGDAIAYWHPLNRPLFYGTIKRQKQTARSCAMYGSL